MAIISEVPVQPTTDYPKLMINVNNESVWRMTADGEGVPLTMAGKQRVDVDMSLMRDLVGELKLSNA
ncbi:MAG: hypothetical protein ACPGQQ_00770 [Candidatus Puniceispirillaceae bacterium]